jgi:hypothetical protein
VTTIRDVRETITVGPVPMFFCNTNSTMKLKGHCHHAFLTVVYETLPVEGGNAVGYPSFEVTNNGLREHIRALTGTERPFRDATNEEVLRCLWLGLDGWRHPSWDTWSGSYQLHALHLDVLSAIDRIGHDAGTTRYSIERLERR